MFYCDECDRTLTPDEVGNFKKSVLSFIELDDKRGFTESNGSINLNPLDPVAENRIKWLYNGTKKEYGHIDLFCKLDMNFYKGRKLNPLDYLEDENRNKWYHTGWNNPKLFNVWFNIKEKKKHERFYFYTFTGNKRIPDTSDNIDKMRHICTTIFNNEKFIRFKEIAYNIETGKHEENPNLHIHALIDFNKSNKNFDRDFKGVWMKEFKDYGIDFKKGGKQLFKGKNVNDVWYDKLAYLRNDEKSILHQNYRDLEIFEHLELA